MTHRSPVVSIGTPVYNGENYLSAAIEALLAQTFTDFELIISDNASTDGTPDICQAFARRDARIRYERQSQNRGAAWNHNRLVQLARGEFFKWASHDDLHSPTYLERCLALIRSDPGITWCHSRVMVIDASGKAVSTDISAFSRRNQKAQRVHSLNQISSPYTRHTRSSPLPHQRFDGIVLSSTWGLDCYGLIRIADLRRTRGMLATYGSERTLLAELAMLGRYAEVPETLFQVRIHPAASGRHMTIADQQAHAGPRTGSRWIHPRAQMLLDYLTVVARAPISITGRACCLWTIAKYVMQVHKWRRVLQSLARGTGTGGGNELFLEDNRTSQPQGASPAVDSVRPLTCPSGSESKKDQLRAVDA
jgi:hypothetical protein